MSAPRADIAPPRTAAGVDFRGVTEQDDERGVHEPLRGNEASIASQLVCDCTPSR